MSGKQRGVVVTFYSYKGGVGRSLAIANTAHLLHQAGHSVVVCDLDLEAPGIERYLLGDGSEPWIERLNGVDGFVDLVAAFRQAMREDEGASAPSSELVDSAPGHVEYRGVSLPDPVAYLQDVTPHRSSDSSRLAQTGPGDTDSARIELLTAGGRVDRPAYAEAVRRLDWGDLYRHWGGGAFVAFLRERLTERADFVLIDARTGVTELGGVASHDLADLVVLMTNATRASLDGIDSVARSLQAPATANRRGGRVVHLLPIASRIDLIGEADDLRRHQRDFRARMEPLVTALVRDEGPDAATGSPSVLSTAELCYVPKYSFAERVIALEDPDDQHEELIARYRALSSALQRFGARHRATRTGGGAGAASTHATERLRVFLSYRRGDVDRLVHSFKSALDSMFGSDANFLDCESLRPGEQWSVRLEQELSNASLFVLFLGPQWLRAADEWGVRRIDSEDDWCRRELEQALARGIPILPILAGGAHVPPQAALPETLRALTDFQALSIDPEDWGAAIARVVDRIRSLAPALTPSAEPRLPDVLVHYAHQVVRACDRLVSFFPGANQHRLADVYVELLVGETGRGEGRSKHGLESGGLRSPRATKLAPDFSGRLSLRALLESDPDETGSRAWVVLGEPGAGKSTAARHLALELAQELVAASAADFVRVPVYLPMSMLAMNGGRHPFAAIESVMRRHGQDAESDGLRDRLFAIARGETPGEVWLLLDGLDEVAPEAAHDLRGGLRQWAEQLEHVRVAVFSRSIGYSPLGDPFEAVRLRPLDRDDRQRLLKTWVGQGPARNLVNALERHRELVPLLGNPLLLTLLARLWLEHKALPFDRTRLFGRSIELLLRTPWDRREPIRAPADVLRVLGALALELQTDEASAWSFDALNRALWAARERSPSVERILDSLWKGDNERFLRDVERQTGVLASDAATGSSWTFLHRQFREYLSADGIARSHRKWDEIVDLSAEGLPRWSEAIGMYCGLAKEPMSVLRRLRESSPEATIKALAEVDGRAAGELFEFVWSVPSEIEGWRWSREQPSRFRWDGDDLLRLVDAWLRRGRWTVAEARAALLGRVGPKVRTAELSWCYYVLSSSGLGGVPDPGEFFERAGRPMPNPREFDWVPVPVGEFEMGSPDDEPERLDSEGPQHEVRVSEFGLLRCAVTNAQYARFDSTHGVEDFGGKVKDPSGHPVVNVDWWCAYLFSAWIGGRLPSEAEWEYGCRAGTRGPFSFEGELSPERVNYDGNYPYAGAPKGEYRKGTVPVGELLANGWGLQEMHGNVWEWCQDRWQESYEGAPIDGSAWEVGGSGGRVVRGGSWIDYGRRCRSAYRGGLAPGTRAGDVGFRPARSH